MNHRELFKVELHFTISYKASKLWSYSHRLDFRLNCYLAERNVSSSQTFTEAQLARGNLLAMEQFQIGTVQDTASQCSEGILKEDPDTHSTEGPDDCDTPFILLILQR